jgi:hypothetical protein
MRWLNDHRQACGRRHDSAGHHSGDERHPAGEVMSPAAFLILGVLLLYLIFTGKLSRVWGELLS